jgi:hypothetical protein
VEAIMKRYTVLILCVVAFGCGSPSATSATSKATPVKAKQLNRTVYKELLGGASATMAALSLCDLVRYMPWMAAGLYKVDSLTGYTEPVTGVDTPTGYSAFTYVEMTLIDAWSPGAPSKTVARISGGPTKNGSTQGWYVALKVGEPVGVFLMKPTPENLDFPNLHPAATFNLRAGGGFSSEVLFSKMPVDAGKLGDLIRGLWGVNAKAPCPYDELPDYNKTTDATGSGGDGAKSPNGSFPVGGASIGKTDAGSPSP